MTSTRTLEILIVEDSYLIAHLLKASLSGLAAGHGLLCDFVVAPHVGAARSHMGLRRFDAIALDLNLADGGRGEDLIPHAAGSHVVVLSGLDGLLDGPRLEAVRKLAPAAILAKPTPWPEVALALLAPWVAQPTEAA